MKIELKEAYKNKGFPNIHMDHDPRKSLNRFLDASNKSIICFHSISEMYAFPKLALPHVDLWWKLGLTLKMKIFDKLLSWTYQLHFDN